MSSLRFDRNFPVEAGVVERVSPLVRRLVCGNPSAFTFKGTSTYIVGTGTVAVIDPGPEDDTHLAALLRALDGETVSHILVTHSHADHSPLAAKLQRDTGAKTYGFGPVVQSAGQSLRLDASIDGAFSPDVRMGDGDTVTGKTWTLEALTTPGHMSNHLCFALEQEQALFSGDHVMAWATSVIAPPDGNMGAYFASLRKLLTRPDRIYHPGHGPSRRDPLPLVRGYLAHRRMREAAILQRVRDGDRLIAEIVPRLYADIDPKLHGAAALSVRAHLDHLVEQRLAREIGGGFEAV